MLVGWRPFLGDPCAGRRLGARSLSASGRRRLLSRRRAADRPGRRYTWLWPDGASTYAAHYPNPAPALIGVLYAVLGGRVVVAMAFNAVLGACAVFAAQRVVIRRNSRFAALIAGLLVGCTRARLLHASADDRGASRPSYW